MSTTTGAPQRFPRIVRILAIPIAIFWLALAASSNALIPPLEEIGRVNNVAQSAKDSPSLIAAKRVGTVFIGIRRDPSMRQTAYSSVSRTSKRTGGFGPARRRLASSTEISSGISDMAGERVGQPTGA